MILMVMYSKLEREVLLKSWNNLQIFSSTPF